MSKTLAEEVAWKFSKENGMDMVIINLQSTLNYSLEMILNLKDDIDEVTSANYTSVDVRDVALAHVKAFEVASASGRYNLAGSVTPMVETLQILKKLHPSLCPPEISEHDIPTAPEHSVSQEKAKSLGVSFRTLESSLRDTVESMKEMGFLKA